MKKLLIILFYFLFSINFVNAESRFGELTEIRDERMRGKEGQWVRPHPGPFIWNHIEKEKGNFKEVVLVEYPKKESWTIAFVTAYSVNENGVQYVHLFVPTTPNPTSGIMLFVKKTNIRNSGMTVEEGLKALISGGMIAPEKNNLP